MSIVFFVIFASCFAVAVLTLLAFFPIRVSWFYYRAREPRPEKPRQQPKRREGNAYKNYTRFDDDTFDDQEL